MHDASVSEHYFTTRRNHASGRSVGSGYRRFSQQSRAETLLTGTTQRNSVQRPWALPLVTQPDFRKSDVELKQTSS